MRTRPATMPRSRGGPRPARLRPARPGWFSGATSALPSWPPSRRSVDERYRTRSRMRYDAAHTSENKCGNGSRDERPPGGLVVFGRVGQTDPELAHGLRVDLAHAGLG